MEPKKPNGAKKKADLAPALPSTAMAIRKPFIQKDVWDQISTMSVELIASQALPATIKNKAQLCMVLMAGYEIGLGAMESLNSFYIIDGKLTLYGAVVISQLNRQKYGVKWGKCTKEEANVTITNLNGDEHTETYTFAEAVESGLTTKTNWTKYRRDMLRWKCIGRAIRFFCPEALSGHYLKEEIEADPNIIEGEVKHIHVGVDGGVEGGDTTVTAVRNNETGEVEVIPPKEAASDTEAPKPKLPDTVNRRIHANWNKLAELEKWDGKDGRPTAESVRKMILKKYYGKDSNNDLTLEEADDFVKRIEQKIVGKGEPVREAPPLGDEKPVETTVECPSCKCVYGTVSHESDVASINLTTFCNACIAKL